MVVAQSERQQGPLPARLAATGRQAYPPLSPQKSDALALPDEKWVEVASFLRREARQNDVAVGPEEFGYLCDRLRCEFLPEGPSKMLTSQSIVILHKGRLAYHSQAALEALRSTTPIFANEVFVLFSRIGKSIPGRARIHLASLR
jgi:hypothetical protein